MPPAASLVGSGHRFRRPVGTNKRQPFFLSLSLSCTSSTANQENDTASHNTTWHTAVQSNSETGARTRSPSICIQKLNIRALTIFATPQLCPANVLSDSVWSSHVGTLIAWTHPWV
ncbi:hypothetical protein E4T42_09126 [Aureobasidium subglaciale]|nr:hypothetical protein E4T42_09126 [Aureobasidium subglaciale]